MKKQDLIYKPRYLLYSITNNIIYAPGKSISIYPNELITKKDEKSRLSYYVWGDYDFMSDWEWRLIKLTKTQYLDIIIGNNDNLQISDMIEDKIYPWDKLELITIEEARKHGPY